jgi:uncharacterized protein
MDDNTDLAALDAYLSSEDSPDDCMMLSDLDGFLHGVICSPVAIPSEEWMTVALGADAGDVPDWVLHDITDLYVGIAKGLADSTAVVEPIFWQANEGHVIAMDWCEGFMQAVSLRPKEWLRLIESGSDGHLTTPIMLHMLDDNGNSAMGVPQEELDEVLAEAAEAIPETVAGIFDYWQRDRPQ